MLNKMLRILSAFFNAILKKNFEDIDKTASIGKKTTIKKVKIGKYSGINDNCVIVNTQILNFVNISWNVTIGPRNHIFSNFTSHDFIYNENEHIPIANDGCFEGFFNKIGHDVWIGCHSIITTGVEIGNGAVVAAGSVVTKSVPPYAIVGGNPAKFIKWRFSKKQILQLENSKWYQLSISEIIKIKPELEKLVGFDISSIVNQPVKKPFLKHE